MSTFLERRALLIKFRGDNSEGVAENTCHPVRALRYFFSAIVFQPRSKVEDLGPPRNLTISKLSSTLYWPPKAHPFLLYICVHCSSTFSLYERVFSVPIHHAFCSRPVCCFRLGRYYFTPRLFSRPSTTLVDRILHDANKQGPWSHSRLTPGCGCPRFRRPPRSL